MQQFSKQFYSHKLKTFINVNKNVKRRLTHEMNEINFKTKIGTL